MSRVEAFFYILPWLAMCGILAGCGLLRSPRTPDMTAIQVSQSDWADSIRIAAYLTSQLNEALKRDLDAGTVTYKQGKPYSDALDEVEKLIKSASDHHNLWYAGESDKRALMLVSLQSAARKLRRLKQDSLPLQIGIDVAVMLLIDQLAGRLERGLP